MKFVVRWLLLCMLVSCGVQPAQTPVEQKPPTPGGGGDPDPDPNGKASFSDAQSVMQKYCVDCHASAAFTKNEQALIGSSAKSRVQNATMPPPYATPLPAAEKAKFLNFFSE